MKHIAKAIIKKKKTYLILKRSPSSKTFPNMWDFAGGKLDAGETPEESVVREVKEETNLDIEHGEQGKIKKYRSPELNLNFHYFKPTRVNGQIKISHDHTEYKWATEEEIKELDLHPAVQLHFKFHKN